MRTTRERIEWLLPLFVHIFSRKPKGNLFLSYFTFFFSPSSCVCVFAFWGVVVVHLFKILLCFFSIPFLILFNFSFQISRPQVVSDKAKADWRKLLYFILFLFIFFLLLNCSVLLRTLVAALFRRDPVIVVVVAFWVEVGCFVDCAVRGKVIVYWTDSRHTKVAIV